MMKHGTLRCRDRVTYHNVGVTLRTVKRNDWCTTLALAVHYALDQLHLINMVM